MKCFKALNAAANSGLGLGNVFEGSLPSNNEPGEWVVVQGQLQIDKNSLFGDHGIHLASKAWITRYLCDELYEAEQVGEALREGRYFVARKVRLLRQLANWNARTGRLFACDCAQHVLRHFESQRPNDKRPREAIEVARRFANGQASEEEMETAKNGAFAAHEEVGLKQDGVSAALSAMMSADNDQTYGAIAREAAQTAVAAIRERQKDKERRWQTRLLFRILRGELHE